MKRIQLALLIALGVTSAAAAADRLTDYDLRALVGRIQEGRGQFKDALSSELKDSVLRGPNGEVKVDRVLDDFKDSIDRLGERIKPDYTAGTEAATVLKQASAIDRYFRQQPSGIKGESEWNRVAKDMQLLAAAYSTQFPTPETATLRRIGDREFEKALKDVEQAAGRVKDSIDGELSKNPAIQKQTRDDGKATAAAVEKDAKTLLERVGENKPTSAEAQQLMLDIVKLQAFLNAHPTPSTEAWAKLTPSLKIVAEGFGAPMPGAR